MKFAVATVLLAVLLIGAHGAPQAFNFAGMKGMIDSTSIVNGEETSGTQEMSRVAEEYLKSMIHKHLANKRSAKKIARKGKSEEVQTPVQQEAVPAKVPAKINTINWEEHPESKTLIDEKIPGGSASVDALIKLLQEQQAKQ